MQLKTKRIVCVLLVGLLLIASAGAWLFFKFARPVGSGAAGPIVSRDLFSPTWTGRPI
jgi:hypothetical protein